MIEQKPDKQKLLNLVLTAKELEEDKQWQGTNAANILLKIDREIFAGQDLSFCQLHDVDFYNCYFHETKLQHTTLSNCKFSETLFKANFVNADFKRFT